MPSQVYNRIFVRANMTEPLTLALLNKALGCLPGGYLDWRMTIIAEVEDFYKTHSELFAHTRYQMHFTNFLMKYLMQGRTLLIGIPHDPCDEAAFADTIAFCINHFCLVGMQCGMESPEETCKVMFYNPEVILPAIEAYLIDRCG